MNPVFDPGTSGAPQFVPGTNPQLFTAGGDPGTVGGGPGQVAQTPGTPAGGSGVPEDQQQHLSSPGGPSTRPAPNGGSPSLGGFGVQPSNTAAMAAWDPAMHPGRRRPTMPGWTNPNHQGPIGMDWSRYAMGGNMGNSPAGATGRYQPVDSVGDYPWMTDTSTQWGGGPFGYLPINYQPQAYSYYQNTQNLAPWEQKYMQDTWTQNYDRNQPGFVNTNRLANDPNYAANLRG